jgi:predicted nucleic acid-binding Zn ribbon protein
MERAGKLITKWKKSRDCVSAEDLARTAWSRAAGKKITAHATGLKLVRKRLVVQVEDDLWRRQLYGLRQQILHNLREALGEGIVESLEFRLAPDRIGPGREERVLRKPAARQSRPADDADGIADPILRAIYRKKRGKAS